MILSQRPGPFSEIVFSALPPPWSNQAPPPCGAWLRSCRPEGHTRWPEGSIPEASLDRRADRQLPQDFAYLSSGSVITARIRNRRATPPAFGGIIGGASKKHILGKVSVLALKDRPLPRKGRIKIRPADKPFTLEIRPFLGFPKHGLLENALASTRAIAYNCVRMMEAAPT